MSDAALDEARDAAAVARERLLATTREIQDRLAPATLLDDAVGDVRRRSVRLAHITGDTIRERPAVFGAAALAGVVLLVAHRPLLRLGRRLFGRAGETENDAAS
ncbi:MAG TPA: hypothetical protein VGC10_10300 [Sphingomonas sp.]